MDRFANSARIREFSAHRPAPSHAYGQLSRSVTLPPTQPRHSSLCPQTPHRFPSLFAAPTPSSPTSRWMSHLLHSISRNNVKVRCPLFSPIFAHIPPFSLSVYHCRILPQPFRAPSLLLRLKPSYQPSHQASTASRTRERLTTGQVNSPSAREFLLLF